MFDLKNLLQNYGANHIIKGKRIENTFRLIEECSGLSKYIVGLTGAMKNGKCEINNPLGKCCSPIIQKTINKALKMKS